MPIDVIKPNSHLELKYRKVPRKGRIEFDVEASAPVTTFIVDDEGLREYKKRGSDVLWRVPSQKGSQGQSRLSPRFRGAVVFDHSKR